MALENGWPTVRAASLKSIHHAPKGFRDPGGVQRDAGLRCIQCFCLGRSAVVASAIAVSARTWRWRGRVPVHRILFLASGRICGEHLEERNCMYDDYLSFQDQNLVVMHNESDASNARHVNRRQSQTIPRKPNASARPGQTTIMDETTARLHASLPSFPVILSYRFRNGRAQ
jgi:hypothetical protein